MQNRQQYNRFVDISDTNLLSGPDEIHGDFCKVLLLTTNDKPPHRYLPAASADGLHPSSSYQHIFHQAEQESLGITPTATFPAGTSGEATGSSQAGPQEMYPAIPIPIQSRQPQDVDGNTAPWHPHSLDASLSYGHQLRERVTGAAMQQYTHRAYGIPGPSNESGVNTGGATLNPFALSQCSTHSHCTTNFTSCTRHTTFPQLMEEPMPIPSEHITGGDVPEENLDIATVIATLASTVHNLLHVLERLRLGYHQA